MSSGLKTEFQQALDAFIEHFGVVKGTFILHCLNHQLKAKIDGKKIRASLIGFVIRECAKVYGISEVELYNGTRRIHAEARWVAVHLVKRYTRATYNELTLYFNRRKRALMYAYTKCKEALEVPHFEKQLNERYQTIESNLIAFIIKIKSHGE